MSYHSRLLVLTIIGTLTQEAGAAPNKYLPGDQHQPPVFLDLSNLSISLRSSDDQYVVDARLAVGGGGDNDRVRFEWRSGAKVLGTGTCDGGWSPDFKVINADCELKELQKAAGAIEVDVIYADDKDDREYLVATLKTEVRVWRGLDKRKVYGIIPDDLLAPAFVRFYKTDKYNTSDRNEFGIHFWSTNDSIASGVRLRCAVDGKQLPDIDAGLKRDNAIESSFTNEKESRTYRFQQYALEPRLYYGARRPDDTSERYLIDNPGTWDCAARVDGKPLRQFRFIVDKTGMIQQSEIQSGKRAIPTLERVVMIEMKIPANNGLEKRIRPEAMKKSLGFGIPWPEHPKVKELHAAFPPASGLPD